MKLCHKCVIDAVSRSVVTNKSIYNRGGYVAGRTTHREGHHYHFELPIGLSGTSSSNDSLSNMVVMPATNISLVPLVELAELTRSILMPVLPVYWRILRRLPPLERAEHPPHHPGLVLVQQLAAGVLSVPGAGSTGPAVHRALLVAGAVIIVAIFVIVAVFFVFL